jgi:hypothetical protein
MPIEAAGAVVLFGLLSLALKYVWTLSHAVLYPYSRLTAQNIFCLWPYLMSPLLMVTRQKHQPQ